MRWGAATAKLRSLIERTFLPGIALAYEDDGHFPKKLFECRTARVLITTDTPRWYRWGSAIAMGGVSSGTFALRS